MKNVRILDCTLRDGGFINDWNFGFGSIKSIVSRLAVAGIDIIELGFIDNRRIYDQDRSIVPDTKSIDPILENIDLKDSMVVAMIDYGTVDLVNISPRNESCIDGIRVIFKKKDQDKALEFLSAIKAKGYKIFVQPVSITSYSEDEILTIIEKINKIDPYAVSVVDTYGLMHDTDLLHYFDLFDKHLNKAITIGYHSHNNFQLAYSNSLELARLSSDRDLVLDTSLYGMGKGAGNANTELLAMYLNEHNGKRYGIDQILEAIDVDVMKEFQKHTWGYSFLYYLSALNDCHPDYVKYLLELKTLAVKSVNEILEMLEPSTKLTFNRNAIEQLYKEYQEKSWNDESSYSALRKDVEGKPVLLLGPGASIETDSSRIRNFISTRKPVTFSINFINDEYDIDYVFMGNSKRYSQFFHKIYGDTQHAKVICTSNITQLNKKIDMIFNYGELTMDVESVRDNPLLMLLKILQKCGCRDITLAGFDGYSPEAGSNYYKEYIPLLYCADDVLMRNSAISEAIKAIGRSVTMTSLTKSAYL